MNRHNVGLILTAGLSSQLPGVMRSEIPQVALCGRSNVGKSSLINKLLGRKKLARVSSEPGKTVTVNCYDVDGKLYLVDLPGYGYAKRSFAERKKWKGLVEKYFSIEAHRLYLQLVDLKVGLTGEDEEMLQYLIAQDLPFAVAATKADKPNKTDKARFLEAITRHPLIPNDAAVIPFSAMTGEGVDQIWDIITDFLGFIDNERQTPPEVL